jgi:putative transposase
LTRPSVRNVQIRNGKLFASVRSDARVDVDTHGMKRLPERKRHKLDPAEYRRTGSIWSIVLAVKRRQRVFAVAESAAGAVEALWEVATTQATPMHAWCVMPDHIHIILSPSERCSIPTFVNRFKKITRAQAKARGVAKTYWQRSFWDRGVRHHHQLDREVMYVMRNPVRGGLVTDMLDYPWSFATWLEAARERREKRALAIRKRLEASRSGGSSPAPTRIASVNVCARRGAPRACASANPRRARPLPP